MGKWLVNRLKQSKRGTGPNYKYIRNVHYWWKDKRIRYEASLKDKLRAHPPKNLRMTRKMKKPLEDKYNHLLEIKICDKTQHKTYWGKRGLFLKKLRKQKVWKPYEFEQVCFGTFVTQIEYERWRNKDQLNEYVISFKLNKKDKQEIVLVPNLNGKRPIWCYANDGIRKCGRNYSNCEFLEKKINGTWMIILTNTKKMKSGQQILVKYGKRYWREYGDRLQ